MHSPRRLSNLSASDATVCSSVKTYPPATWSAYAAASSADEFSAMSDPDFLAERKRVRETLEALTERYRAINIEFDRRAGAQWASASRG